MANRSPCFSAIIMHDLPSAQELISKVAAVAKLYHGYNTTEDLSASLLDQAWHVLTPTHIPTDAIVFEKEAFHTAGVDFPPVPPRFRSFYFSHAFAGGYA